MRAIIAATLFEVRLSFIVLVAVLGSALSTSSAPETVASSALSPRAQVTIENWDKGGALSHWVYTHVSEVLPSAVVRRGGAIVDLPVQLRPEIGALKLNKPGEPDQTLDQFVNNGAVDGCIVLHAGKIVYEKYPTISPNELHIMMSVTKAAVLTALAILEDQGKVDLTKPVENYLPELKGSDWAGTPLRDLVDMRSGMEGAETSIDAYRNPPNNSSSKRRSAGNRAPRRSCTSRRFACVLPHDQTRTPGRTKMGLHQQQHRSDRRSGVARDREKFGRCNQRSHLEQNGS